MKEYEAYIFDLDGTLLDTLPDLVVLTNRVLEEEGLKPCTQDEIHRFVGDGLEALMRRCVEVRGQHLSDAVIAQLMNQWRALYPAYGSPLTKPYPHIVELLGKLRSDNKKLAVLSNKFDAGTQEVISLFFPGVFSVVHGECPGVPRKPDPAGLIKTMEELAVAPERAVYIGDSPNDAQVARRAGTEAIVVSWGYHPRTEFEELGIQPIVDDPLEILW